VKHVKAEKAPADTMDSIRQWQRHYRKAFPQFVFYFDSIPEDVRRRFSRQVIALGAVSHPTAHSAGLGCISCLPSFSN
jgi:regulatory subunit for Cdc7p protein kinase